MESHRGSCAGHLGAILGLSEPFWGLLVATRAPLWGHLWAPASSRKLERYRSSFCSDVLGRLGGHRSPAGRPAGRRAGPPGAILGLSEPFWGLLAATRAPLWGHLWAPASSRKLERYRSSFCSDVLGRLGGHRSPAGRPVGRVAKSDLILLI